MMESPKLVDEYDEAIKKLESKAELLRHLHSLSARRYTNRIDTIVYSTIFLSIVISFLSIADPELLGLKSSDMMWISRAIALSSIVILFLSISDRLFGLNEKKAAHSQAVQLLTDFIRECNQCRHTQLSCLDVGGKNKIAEEKREEYAKITHIIPDAGVSDEEFLIEKQILKIKIDLSSRMDKDHFLDATDGLKKIGKLRRTIRKIRIMHFLKLR
jgi:hypothetical protein